MPNMQLTFDDPQKYKRFAAQNVGLMLGWGIMVVIAIFEDDIENMIKAWIIYTVFVNQTKRLNYFQINCYDGRNYFCSTISKELSNSTWVTNTQQKAELSYV